MAWVLISCVVSNAQSQILVTSSVDDAHTHAWAVYATTDGEPLFVHLPPRDGDAGAPIPIDPAQPGELHAVRPLSTFPDGLAAFDNRVYLVFPSVAVGDRQIRRVYSGRIVASPVGSVWGFVPSGRLDSEPAIQSTGELIDFVATSDAVWALLKENDQYTLITLGNSSWSSTTLPAAESASWRLSAQGSQLVAVDVSDSKTMRAYGLRADQTTWQNDWPQANKPVGEFEFIAGVHGLYILDRDANGLTRIQTWSSAGVFTIATEVDVPTDTSFAAMGSVNRLVGLSQYVSTDIDPDDSTTIQPAILVHEIDLSDGTLIYTGPPVVSSPVSAAEMRFLMGMMVLIMIGVLVVVIMPDKADAMGIPDGFALADPGRRLIATMFDVFLVSFIMGLLFDVRVSEIITLSVIVRSDTAWLVIPSVMVSGIIIMSVLEWLFGASVGKWMMGIRVVRGQGGAMERIPLWAAFVRNVIKWLLPPVTALALIDPEMLHRGDRATRTLVVAPIEGYEGAESTDESTGQSADDSDHEDQTPS
ncbi:MAG: RDD family protein [Phycisphaerales bacterium]|nr:RDD family protein [Phycisphaerales bacterium]